MTKKKWKYGNIELLPVSLFRATDLGIKMSLQDYKIVKKRLTKPECFHLFLHVRVYYEKKRNVFETGNLGKGLSPLRLRFCIFMPNYKYSLCHPPVLAYSNVWAQWYRSWQTSCRLAHAARRGWRSSPPGPCCSRSGLYDPLCISVTSGYQL